MSSKPRHKQVQFNPEAWMADTARMSRLVRSVFFDVCVYNWQHAAPMPEAELMMVLQDVGVDGPNIIDLLMQTGKVVLSEDAGSHGYYVAAALEEAMRAADLFERKSGGGKKGSAKTNGAKSHGSTGDGIAIPPNGPPNDITLTPPLTPRLEAIASLPISGEIDGTEDQSEPKAEDQEDPEAKAKADAEAADREAAAERLRREAEKREKRSADVATIASTWNAMAAANKFQRIAKLTDERRKKIGARLDEQTVDELVEAIGVIPERSWCVGDGRQWVTIDWFLRPNTATRLREGAYHGTPPRGGWAEA